MDFHSLGRRDLQALCKKNKIPANMTNLAMADALKSLKSVEWDEDMKQKVMLQSEKSEQHSSPLPGSRRVSARSGNIPSFSMEEANNEENAERKKESYQTPSTAVRRSQRVQSVTSTRAGTSKAGTRTRAGKKEDASPKGVEVVAVEANNEETKKEASIEANQTPETAVRRSQRIQSAMSTKTRTRTSTTAAGTVTSTARVSTRVGKKEDASPDVVAIQTPAPSCGRKNVQETPSEAARQSTRRPAAESVKGSRVTRTIAALNHDEPNIDVNEVSKETAQAKEHIESNEENMTAVNEVAKETEHMVEQIESNEESITEVKEVAKETEHMVEEIESNEETVTEVDEVAKEAEHMVEQIESSEENITEVNEAAKETEQAKEQTEAVDLVKEDGFVAEEKLNLMEHVEEETAVESTEEHIETAIPISEEQNGLPEDKSNFQTESLEVELNSRKYEKKGVADEKSEETEEKLNRSASEEVESLFCDELEKGKEICEEFVEEIIEKGSDSELISEGQAAHEKEKSRSTFTDSPVMGLVSEVTMNADPQEICITPSEITLDAFELPSEICIPSPVRTQVDPQEICITPSEITLDAFELPSEICIPSPVRTQVVDMSVMKHVADSPTMGLVLGAVPENSPPRDITKEAPSDVCVSPPRTDEVVENENADKGRGDLSSLSLRKLKAMFKENGSGLQDAPPCPCDITIHAQEEVVVSDVAKLVQNENGDKGRVDLNKMSLRKLKAMYKDKLVQLNSTEVGAGGAKRLPLGQLDNNLEV